MAYHVVAAVEDIPPGTRRVVDVRGRAIVVFNVDGEFYAMLNRCPHQGGDMSKGLLTVAVTSRQPGEYDYCPERKVVRCPWHSWEFDIRTGRSWCEPDRVRTRSFPTEVKQGAELVEGPYQAETFETTTKGSYVLVDV
ncbi:Rieske (2Fe-2S) protein [Marinivivus vitaminiproducens]|uniref:Rieske (2Fe-2S) protein n=1 Tax=Marinivivus vitaminiproducens TaxID=3035935 RepID=UPI00279DA5F9|nr:Rieske (2Fe-2S) protein [Geminicoccaceae bacterium SCSIO 64248]